MSDTKTIGKMLVSIIAILVLFVPVVAVQQIEARTVTHVLTTEGLYVNGTEITTTPITNATMEIVEDVYSGFDVNASATYDTAMVFNGGGTNKDIYYRDTTTYIGNGTYTVSLDYSDWPSYSASNSWVLIPLDINLTELIEPDFIRIHSDYTPVPRLFVLASDGLGGVVSSYGFITGYEVSADNYVFVNTISSRSWMNNVNEDYPLNQVFVAYQVNPLNPPTMTDFTVKVQTETFEGADIITWNDETLYIMSIVLCDVLLIGSFLLASDPIDIIIDRKRR